jgi:hypothetical protein
MSAPSVPRRGRHLVLVAHLPQCALSVNTTVPPVSTVAYQQSIVGECIAFSAAGRLLPHPTGPADVAGNVRALDPLFGQFLRDMRAQPLPTAGAPSIHSWINATAKVQSDLHAMATAIANHDQTAFNTAKAKAAADQHSAHIDAHTDGIPQCG